MESRSKRIKEPERTNDHEDAEQSRSSDPSGRELLTQAVSGHRHPAPVVRVPLQKQGVESVHLQSHRVQDGLAVGGAVVEKHV